MWFILPGFPIFALADTPEPGPNGSRTTAHMCLRRPAAAWTGRQCRSNRIRTRGNPFSTESVSEALVKPARSKSLRVPTYAMV